MKFDVHYGSGIQKVNIPDTCRFEVLEGREVPGVDEERVMRKALEHPLGSRGLDEFLNGGKLLIVVNDGDRPTPTPKFLAPLIDRIQNRPDTKILVACGTHRMPSQEDLHLIFGRFYELLKDKVSFHQAKDRESLMSFGTTKLGNEILMNKLVGWADKLLITGSVEPHYFAGFTGGRKWVIGVAGFDTLERNHKLSLRPETAALALEGNPLHEELVEWDGMIKKEKFCINVVLDRNMAIAAAFAGDITRVFEECVKVGTKMYSAMTEGNADIVLTVARPPQDSNLYQALKAQEHGKLAMRNGGIIILVAECHLGLGPSHFIDMLKDMDLEVLMRNIEKDFHLGEHKIAKLVNTLKKGRVWAVTDVPADDVASVQMERFGDVQEALDKAIAIMGKNAKVIFLPDGGMTVPHVVKEIPARTAVKIVARAVAKGVRKRVAKRTSKVRAKVRARVRGRVRKVRGRVRRGIALVRKARKNVRGRAKRK